MAKDVMKRKLKTYKTKLKNCEVVSIKRDK